MRWRQKRVNEDPLKDMELLRLFQSLGPPPSRQASPYLRAQVRARIEEHCAHSKGLRRVAWLRSPLWAAGLATGILLAIGVWWGMGQLGVPGGSAQHAGAPLAISQFQRSVHQPQALGKIAAARISVPEFSPGRGFMAAESGVMFFRLGTLYADALATLYSGTLEPTVPPLQALTKGLERLQAPPSLVAHAQESLSIVQHQRYPGEVVARLLALFETLYETEYTTQGNNAAVTLFQAGAWVENLSLAAAMEDIPALQQGLQALATFHSALARLHVPLVVQEALSQLRQVSARRLLTAADVPAVHRQLKTIQQHLGAFDTERRLP